MAKRTTVQSVTVHNPSEIIVEANGMLFGWYRDERPSREIPLIDGRQVHRIYGTVNIAQVDTLCVCFVADYFDPPAYLVGGDGQGESGWLDCLNWFETECEHLIRLDDSDLADREANDPDSIDYNDNGTPVDTESVQCWGARIVRVA